MTGASIETILSFGLRCQIAAGFVPRNDDGEGGDLALAVALNPH